MKMKSATRRSYLPLRISLLITPILLGSGGCNYDSTAQKPDLGITLEVFVDRSGSTQGYPGGYTQIQSDYSAIAHTYVKAVLAKSKNVHVVIREFVRNTITVFDAEVSRFEQIAKPLNSEIQQPVFPNNVASETRFSDLIATIGDDCASNSTRKVMILVLTDGHPDDSYKEITAAAQRYQAKTTNLLSLFIAPVAPDIKHRWAENLRESLTPLGNATQVVNANDFQPGVKTALENLENK